VPGEKKSDRKQGDNGVKVFGSEPGLLEKNPTLCVQTVFRRLSQKKCRDVKGVRKCGGEQENNKGNDPPSKALNTLQGERLTMRGKEREVFISGAVCACKMACRSTS